MSESETFQLSRADMCVYGCPLSQPVPTEISLPSLTGTRPPTPRESFVRAWVSHLFEHARTAVSTTIGFYYNKTVGFGFYKQPLQVLTLVLKGTVDFALLFCWLRRTITFGRAAETSRMRKLVAGRISTPLLLHTHAQQSGSRVQIENDTAKRFRCSISLPRTFFQRKVQPGNPRLGFG